MRDVAAKLAQETVERPTALWGFCETCRHAPRCRAGCTWTSHVLFGRPGNNPFCHSRALALAEAGVVETLEPALPAPGQPFDFGRYRIVQAPLDQDLEAADRVIGMMRASNAFGIRPGSPGLWSDQECAEALRKSTPHK